MIMITITRNNISTALFKKKKTRSKYYYNTDLRINNNFDNSYSDCRPCQFAPSAS